MGTMKKERRLVHILFAAVLLFPCCSRAPYISTDDLVDRLGDPELLVIDVRSPSYYEYSEWKIPGSVFEDYTEFEQWAEKYPKTSTLVLYCA